MTGTQKRAVAAAPDGAPTPTGVSAALRRGQEAVIELAAGVVLVGVGAVGGLWFALRPASGRVDGWFLDLVGASRSHWFIDLTDLHHPWVVVVGAVVAAAVTFPRDRPRSLACLLGPPLALLVCEVVVKPLVGRTLGGALSYPSGSTVGAAALATVAVLATPARSAPAHRRPRCGVCDMDGGRRGRPPLALPDRCDRRPGLRGRVRPAGRRGVVVGLRPARAGSGPTGGASRPPVLAVLAVTHDVVVPVTHDGHGGGRVVRVEAEVDRAVGIVGLARCLDHQGGPLSG